MSDFDYHDDGIGGDDASAPSVDPNARPYGTGQKLCYLSKIVPNEIVNGRGLAAFLRKTAEETRNVAQKAIESGYMTEARRLNAAAEEMDVAADNYEAE